MGELSITLRIADRPYKMTIDRRNEETFRKAARLIEEKAKAYATAYEYKDKQDLLAMVSLEYVVKLIDKEKGSLSTEKATLEKLKGIDNELNKFINTPNDL